MLRVFLLLPGLLVAQTTTPPKPTPRKPPVKAAARPAAKVQPRTAQPAAPTMTTDEEKTIYALGLSIARSLSPFDLSPHELAIVQQAMKDAAAGKPALELNTWGPRSEERRVGKECRGRWGPERETRKEVA